MRLMSSKILNDLNNLINTNMEELTGYKSAAGIIHNDGLKEIFVIYIQKKSEYIDELKRVAKELFGNGEKARDFPLQKFSISMSGNESSILKKCQTLEEKSIKKYESVLNNEIPPHIKEMLLKQCNGIKEAQLHMKSLENEY